MNTKVITVSKEIKEKLESKGVLVETACNLPAHLAKFADKKDEKMAEFGMFQVTVNLDKYDDSHPIHALV